MNDKVMIIRYDGKEPREIPGAERHVDNEGMSVYILDAQKAQTAISGSPDRYRLYRSPAQRFSVKNANGSKEYKTFNPWFYRRESYSAGKDENGDTVVAWRTVWIEDKKGESIVPATMEYITGKKRTGDDNELEKAKNEAEKYQSIVNNFEKRLTDLTAAVAELKQKVEELTPKPKKVKA
ncbi:MAG: hypothetical protein PHN44_00130 [Candidatus Marinimicrobia bacterium]|nr:hypothetical protein [Candidatus Neomarinimicrobiota bacterium]